MTAFYLNAARRAGGTADDLLIYLLRKQDHFGGLGFFAESDGEQDYADNFEDESPNVYDVGNVTILRRPQLRGEHRKIYLSTTGAAYL